MSAYDPDGRSARAIAERGFFRHLRFMLRDVPEAAREDLTALAQGLWRGAAAILFLALLPVSLPLLAVYHRNAARREINYYHPGTYRRRFGVMVRARRAP